MEWQIIVAILLVVAGIAGTVLPLLPGVPLVFAGLLLAAWHNSFTEVSVTTMIIIGVIALLAWVVDFVASIVTAKKVGASKQALWGAGIGAVVGIFGGIAGVIIVPAIGAIIGELIANKKMNKELNKDLAGKATTVGIAAGLGFVLALATKIVLVLTMLAIFAYAYYR